jgi:hypothetical protein
VLLCLPAWHGPAVWGREGAAGLLVRQEAPFPAIFDPAPVAAAAEAVRYEVLRGDFHMHTLHSDGRLTPAERVLEAWQYGYDVIAITDHGNFRAYEEARATANGLGLLLLRGMETGLSGNEHLVALDFAPAYQSNSPHQWSDTPGQARVYYRDQWPRLAAAGAFVLYAHPHVGLREPVLWALSQGLLQGIEIKNDVVGSGWNTVESHGTWWYPFAFDWAVEHHLTIFANSDVHAARGDTEQATTLVLVKERSRAGVLEALRTRRTVAQFNGMLCGHEWVLRLLMSDLVEVRLRQTQEARAFVQLRNRGPVGLTAALAGMPIEPIALGGYQTVLVGARRQPDVITVTWKNLYTRPTENLTTTHILIAADPPEN